MEYDQTAANTLLVLLHQDRGLKEEATATLIARQQKAARLISRMPSFFPKPKRENHGSSDASSTDWQGETAADLLMDRLLREVIPSQEKSVLNRLTPRRSDNDRIHFSIPISKPCNIDTVTDLICRPTRNSNTDTSRASSPSTDELLSDAVASIESYLRFGKIAYFISAGLLTCSYFPSSNLLFCFQTPFLLTLNILIVQRKNEPAI